MPAQQQRDGAPALRRQLQPAGGGHGHALGLADHGAQPAMAQPFLHQLEQLGIVGSLGIEHPVRPKPHLREPRREQVAAAHHPQHGAPGARGDSGQEQRRRAIVGHVRPGACHLVQRIEREPTSGQHLVERRHAERQHLAPAIATAFDGAQLRAQGVQDRGLSLGHDNS